MACFVSAVNDVRYERAQSELSGLLESRLSAVNDVRYKREQSELHLPRMAVSASRFRCLTICALKTSGWPAGSSFSNNINTSSGCSANEIDKSEFVSVETGIENGQRTENETAHLYNKRVSDCFRVLHEHCMQHLEHVEA